MKKKLTEQQIIGFVSANSAMENMPLTDDDRNIVKNIILGKTTSKEAIQKVIAKYSSGQ